MKKKKKKKISILSNRFCEEQEFPYFKVNLVIKLLELSQSVLLGTLIKSC